MHTLDHQKTLTSFNWVSFFHKISRCHEQTRSHRNNARCLIANSVVFICMVHPRRHESQTRDTSIRKKTHFFHAQINLQLTFRNPFFLPITGRDWLGSLSLLQRRRNTWSGFENKNHIPVSIATEIVSPTSMPPCCFYFGTLYKTGVASTNHYLLSSFFSQNTTPEKMKATSSYYSHDIYTAMYVNHSKNREFQMVGKFDSGELKLDSAVYPNTDFGFNNRTLVVSTNFVS